MAGDEFDPEKVVDAILDEGATAVLGVPTMFLAELEIFKRRSTRPTTVRTGLAAGSSVPQTLMNRIRDEMGCDGMLIAYGMTETSPVTFITALDDPMDMRLRSLGRVLPHTGAKVVDPQTHQILPRGSRGELCTSGYALQREYYENKAKTEEVMIRDADGVLWMHTGDECFIDEQGYCFITGRLKDIIIRGKLALLTTVHSASLTSSKGGENIYPREIEEHLLQHKGIEEASVVAVKDERYGEVVGAFLRANAAHKPRLSTEEVQEHVKAGLGRHKSPHYVFWIGDEGVGEDFPKTGSGKHQKHIMSALATTLLSAQNIKAKL